MQSNKLVFTGKNVKFFSTLDKDYFDKWIKSIDIIDNVQNDGDDYSFYLKPQNISPQDLDRLVGLFARYLIDTKQLKVFLNDSNRAWFKYWI